MGLVTKKVAAQKSQIQNIRVRVIQEKNMRTLPRIHDIFKKPIIKIRTKFRNDIYCGKILNFQNPGFKFTNQSPLCNVHEQIFLFDCHV